MTLPQHDISRLQSEMSAAVKAHWKAFLFEGILLAILGLAAIIVPPIASLAITIFLGWMFLIAGIGGLIITFWARQMPGFWWSLISAALAVLAGLILLARGLPARIREGAACQLPGQSSSGQRSALIAIEWLQR